MIEVDALLTLCGCNMFQIFLMFAKLDHIQATVVQSTSRQCLHTPVNSVTPATQQHNVGTYQVLARPMHVTFTVLKEGQAGIHKITTKVEQANTLSRLYEAGSALVFLNYLSTYLEFYCDLVKPKNLIESSTYRQQQVLHSRQYKSKNFSCPTLPLT